jgi:hypothetical protein
MWLGLHKQRINQGIFPGLKSIKLGLEQSSVHHVLRWPVYRGLSPNSLKKIFKKELSK